MGYRGKHYDRKFRQKLCFMVMQDAGNQLFTESVLEEVLISMPGNKSDDKEQAIGTLRKTRILKADKAGNGMTGDHAIPSKVSNGLNKDLLFLPLFF